MRRFIIALTLLIGIVAAVPAPAHAADIITPGCADPNNSICKSSGDDPKVIAKMVTNALLYILGIVSVIMIVVGGFRYVLSAGDAAAIKSAKNTILYAVIGLVIALLAFSIVNFVLAKVI